MVLDDIVGQQRVVRSIKSALRYKRVAHAYLFCGPDGTGKSVAASILASTLNCREKGIDPCGRCSSCIKARDGNHPDIIHVKSNNAVIRINEIRALQEDMQKKPYEDGVKVYIIHDAEKMNDEAQNCLLKTLEEPPKHVSIILLAVNQYSLLKTIVSRCQVLKFTKAPEKDIQAYISKKYEVPDEEARFIAAFSDGIVRKAEDFLENDDLKKKRDEILDITRKLHTESKLKVLSYSDYFMSNKDNIDYILEIMMTWFRDILVYKETGDTGFLINLDKKNIVIDECSKFAYNSLDSIINKIRETSDNIKANMNYQLTIEMLLLQIQEG